MPDGVCEHFQSGIGARGQALHDAWWSKFEEYKREYPELAEHAIECSSASCRRDGTRSLPAFSADAKGVATRDASGTGVERDCQERALADRRLGGSRPLDARRG